MDPSKSAGVQTHCAQKLHEGQTDGEPPHPETKQNRSVIKCIIHGWPVDAFRIDGRKRTCDSSAAAGTVRAMRCARAVQGCMGGMAAATCLTGAWM
jgi:hypothetical protein